MAGQISWASAAPSGKTPREPQGQKPACTASREEGRCAELEVRFPESQGSLQSRCRDGVLKKAGLRLPPTGIKSRTGHTGGGRGRWGLGQEPEARPRQHTGAAVQPGRPLLWILAGAALRELDGMRIRGWCLPSLSCLFLEDFKPEALSERPRIGS